MNREKFVRWGLITAIPLVILIWGWNLLSLRKAAPAAGVGALADAAGAQTQVIERQGRRTTHKEWGSDPFRITEAGPETASLNLEGIVMDAVSPFAIINGEIKKEGDEVAGAVVVLIQQSKVILKRGRGEIVLELFQE